MKACVSSWTTHPTSSGCSRNHRSLRVIVSPPVTPGGPSGTTSIATAGKGGSTAISRATASPCSSTSPSAHARIRSRSRRPMAPRDPTQLVVHPGRAGQDVAREIARSVVPVGDEPTGFLHQEAAGSDIPRRETELEETVEHPARGPGEIQTRRARPAEILEPLQRHGERGEVPRKAVLPAERESRSDHRPFRRTLGNVARLRGPACGFPGRTRAACCMPRVAQERRVDRAGERNLIFHERDGYPDSGEAVEEVGGPIERVDDPTQALDHPSRPIAEHRHVRSLLLAE